MKRILISQIDDVAKDYQENIFARCNDKPKNTSLDNVKEFDSLHKLRNIITTNPKKPTDYQKFLDYIDEIWANFDEILLLHPRDADTFVCNHPALSNRILKRKDWKDGNNELEFYEAVVDALRYDYVRDSANGYVKFFPKLGIKSCIYCNANYITNANVLREDKNGNLSSEILGRYELDHFLPKSEYAFMSVSFYNLQPCCSYCNRWKGKKISLFNLFTADATKLDPFKFFLKDDSILNYKVYGKRLAALKILLDCPSDKKLLKNHIKVFQIDKVYESFKEEVEELIWLSDAQTDGNKKNIIASFKSLFTNEKIFRMMYGFYEDGNVHKRPLSKMKKDIAKQLGLF